MDITSKPAAMIVFYENGYKEISKYHKGRFSNFRSLNSEEYTTLISDKNAKESSNCFFSDRIVFYRSEHDFAFIVKNHMKKISFSSGSELEVKVPNCLMRYLNGNIYIYGYNKLFHKLYTYPMPNIHGGNQVCVGSVKKDPIHKAKTIQAKCDAIEMIYFDSNFSGDFFHDKNDFKMLIEKKDFIFKKERYCGDFKRIFSIK